MRKIQGLYKIVLMGKQSREKWEKKELAESGNIGGAVESKNGLEKTWIFIIRWGIYASLFVPLIVMTQFFFPFVAPKTTIFRILVEIIFVAYIFLAFSNSRYKPKIDALTISLTAFLTVFILSSFAGINLSRSFWSTYERMTGIFTMLHLYAFFIILKSVFKKREDWQKILAVSIIVGFILSVYVLKGGSGISTRGGGTIGNSSFLAAYLIFDIFFAIILLLGKKLFWQIFAGVNLIPMMWVFLTSTARGAIAAFFIGLSLLFLGYLFFSGRKILRIAAISLVLISVISTVSLAIIQPSPIKEEVKITLRDMGSRFVVWETGLKGFIERPVLGWGPENFNVAFQKNFNPCMSLPKCGNEVWFDRVHNIIFDTLVTTGIAGLIAYLSIFFVAIYSLFGAVNKIAAAEKRDIFLPLGLAAILIAYFFQNLLVFDMINSYLVFFLALGFIGFLTEAREEKDFQAEKRKKPNKLILSAIIILLIFVFWQGNIKTLIANRYIIKMIQSSNAQEFIFHLNKSLDTWMEKYEAREQADQKLITSGRQLTNLSPEDKEIFSNVFGEVEKEMENSVKENSLDFRHYLFLGELYAVSFRVTGNYDKLERSEAVLEKTITLSPTNQQGYWQLADVNLAKMELDEAISLLKKAVEISPEVGRAHWYLALGYKITGQYQVALNEVYNAENAGYDWRDSKEDAEKVLEIYKALNRDPSTLNEDAAGTIKYLEKFLEKYTDHVDALMSIAAAYANLGMYDKARDAARKIIEVDPGRAPKVEEFLQSLPE